MTFNWQWPEAGGKWCALKQLNRKSSTNNNATRYLQTFIYGTAAATQHAVGRGYGLTLQFVCLYHKHLLLESTYMNINSAGAWPIQRGIYKAKSCNKNTVVSVGGHVWYQTNSLSLICCCPSKRNHTNNSTRDNTA